METSTRDWKWVLFKGIIYLILGIVAMVVPKLFTLSVELVVGWLFLIGGVIQGVRAFQRRKTGDFASTLLLAAIYIVAGLFLLLDPSAGRITLTVLLIAFFIIEGLAKLLLSFQLRKLPFWGWLLFSGLVSLAIAGLIIAGWPSTTKWVLGFLVGINLVVLGISEISMGLGLHRHQQ